MIPESRRIAHLDMDAFFASVALLRYPDLVGQPVVIGGHGPAPEPGSYARLGGYVGRGVLTTASYEARQLGVHSAMGMMKAARLAPDAILLPVDFPSYRHYSRLFKAAVARIAPLVEDRGIDEIYIDLTPLQADSASLARRLKQAVFQATGLRCSIGISPNKLLSKIASDLDKPDGITILQPGDLERRIWPLAVSKINGIGPKATQKLARLGIQTIAQLAHADPALLQRHFGHTYARWLVEVAHGRDDRPVVTHSEPRSISRETTFERDLHVRHDRTLLSAILRELCERLAADLARKQVRSGTIGVKLRFADFSIITRDLTLPEAIADVDAIHQAARACLKRVEFDQRMRLLGVRAAKLVSVRDGDTGQSRPEQLSLY
ncbi:DNA polymerase IV [Castellaniella sp.]|uniref:DNA polymerase IV n=1 Tax=Castellaniella sp. TaxID=1955812 RepID=UPI0035668EEC